MPANPLAFQLCRKCLNAAQIEVEDPERSQLDAEPLGRRKGLSVIVSPNLQDVTGL